MGDVILQHAGKSAVMSTGGRRLHLATPQDPTQ